MDERLALLREIQELEFVLIELNLFLDTHPQERAALRDYAAVRDKLLPAIKRYEEIYGPLTLLSPTLGKCPWQWIEGPWPWEIEYA
jgi:spore coat protein JB